MARTPSLNALRAFHAVAVSGSHAAAAGELGVSISAISRQIRNLEECVGVALLVRDGRRMRLTADGRALEERLADAFAHIADAVESLRRPVRGEKLRVTAPPGFASAWLIPRLERFRELRPETEVILMDSVEKTGVTDSFDLVIAWGCHEGDSHVIAERLSESEEIFPVCDRKSCAGGGLAGATLLEIETVGKPWNWPDWDEFFLAVGLTGLGTVTGPRLATALLLDAVRGGRGVMLANNTMAHDGLAAGWLVRPVAETMKIEDTYWLLSKRAASVRPEVLAFRSWLKKEFAACFGRRGALAA